LKRFAAMTMIAVVVLAMTVGPAFASVCAASQCGPVMPCEMAASPDCPMRTGVTLTHSDCTHAPDGRFGDLVSSQSGPESGLAAAPLSGAVAPPAAILSGSMLPLVDARGAPHLTSVIRI
jgi:hypothetical protein